MSDFPLLPLLETPAPERRDAARNRLALLEAAQRLVDECGVEHVTMDAVAHAAGVGKGTVFRRFESREGLMGALLNHSETEWQAAVLSGPPPLGPGAQPLDRLTAYGQARIDFLIGHLSSAALSQTPARVADRLGRGWSDLVRRVTREA